MFAKQRRKAITIDEMNELLEYCYKYRYIVKGPKPKGEPFKYRLIINLFMFISNIKMVSLFSKVYCKGR